jgi:type IV pilus assembly protein PilV
MNNKSLMNSYPVKQQGVGLIDVMIAVVIFSIGLLAISALQMVSKQSNYEAIQRTNAATHAYEIMERMRMNSVADTAVGVTSSLNYYVSETYTSSTTVPSTRTLSYETDFTACTTCSSEREALAHSDLDQLQQSLLGANETNADGDLVGGLVDPTVCISGPQSGSSGVYTVTIAWRGQTKLENQSDSDCGTGNYNDGSDINAYRRILVLNSFLNQ